MTQFSSQGRALAWVKPQPVYLDITTPTIPGDELAIVHGLGRKPRGYAIIRGPMKTYQHGHDDDDTAWDTNKMYIRFSITDTELTIAVF